MVKTTLLGTVVLLCASLPAQALCPSDCNGDGIVKVDEVVRLVGVALDKQALQVCPPGDSNGDGMVRVNELVQGVTSLLSSCPATVAIHRAPALTDPAGPLADGRGVLPNGRRVEPAGRQVAVETLPLNLVLTSDGQHLFVTNDGYGDDDNEQFVQVIDTDTLAVSRTAIPHFLGLALTANNDRVFVGSDEDGENRVDALTFDGTTLTPEESPFADLPDNTYPTGIALSPNGNYLYVVGMRGNSLHAIEVATGTVHAADAPIGNLPYGVVISADGQRAYVSSWGINNGNPSELPAPLPPLNANREEHSSVAVIDLTDPAAPHLQQYIPIARSLQIDNTHVYGGSHPSAMLLSPDGRLLYVTASNLDLLVVIDTQTLTTIAEIPLNVFDADPLLQRPQGLYPNALAVTADGRRLYVADAGINAVQVLAVDPTARTFTPQGFIPTGWYPAALALTANGKRLYVANGKGAGIGPNGGPGFPSDSYTTYIAQLLKGSVSVIDDVDTYDLTAGRATVAAANGFDAAELRWVDAAPADGEVQRGNPIPIDFGSGPSDVIKHVVYILKENRTYDQVFGDLPGGNGDPSLIHYGSDVTPNARALAQQYATGDNFYCDAEVSTPGHEWADQANCNDFTEKLWPSNYDRNLPSSTLEQGQEGFSQKGFVFQQLERNGVSHRVYGETLALLSRFSGGVNGGGPPSLAGPLLGSFGGRIPTVDEIFTIVNGDIETLRPKGVDVDRIRSEVFPNSMLDFPANILPNRTDVERAALFKQELDDFAARGEFPSYVHIWIPNDHTFGATPGEPTPRSAVADNDAGLGLIVDALTHSPFWPQMAIFVTEDDAQDGEDHVSAHRSISLVISPYVKHGYVSHVHHSTVSMWKTSALILGMPPMSQYDRYATDMRDYFTTTPDLTPYTAIPRTFPPETNPQPAQAANVYLRRAAELSTTLNLSVYDEAGPNLSRVLDLVYVGEQVEREKRWATSLVVSAFVMLIAAGMFMQRRATRRALHPSVEV